MSSHHLDAAAHLAIDRSLKLVLMAVADDADRTTGIAFPGADKLQRWGGLGKSQTAAVLATLIELGYLERLELGRKGRRTTYRVFPRVACCAEHGPMSPEARQELIEDLAEPVDNPAAIGSGGPDPDPLGSGLGSGIGSGPTPDPSLSLNPVGTRESAQVHLGARQPVDKPSPRCAVHQSDYDPPACGACAAARRASEEWEATEGRRRRDEAAAQRREAARLKALEVARCGMCDEQGLRGRAICHHDPEQLERDAANAARVRDLLAASRA